LLKSEHVQSRLNDGGSTFEISSILPLVGLTDEDLPQRNDLTSGLSGHKAYIQIPGDITSLQVRSNETALAWREATRWAFKEALSAGYLVRDFQRTKNVDGYLGTYLLQRMTIKSLEE
jgi:hypothetical protein